MARKCALSDEQAVELFDYIRHGHHSYKDAAKKFGVSQTTASKYYREVLRKRGQEMQASSEGRVVTCRGDDILTFGVEEGYVGHAVVGDVVDNVQIDAASDVDAIVKFDEWLESLEGDREELARIEEEQMWVIGMEKQLAAANMQADGLREELEQAVADADALRDELAAANEEIERLRKELEEGEGRDERALPETVYAVLVERPELRGFGYYLDMDGAFAGLEFANDVARAMGGGNEAFSIHELKLRE